VCSKFFCLLELSSASLIRINKVLPYHFLDCSNSNIFLSWKELHSHKEVNIHVHWGFRTGQIHLVHNWSHGCTVTSVHITSSGKMSWDPRTVMYLLSKCYQHEFTTLTSTNFRSLTLSLQYRRDKSNKFLQKAPTTSDIPTCSQICMTALYFPHANLHDMLLLYNIYYFRSDILHVLLIPTM